MDTTVNGPDHATTDAGADASPLREELHFRRIDMRGFRRNDGLYEIEGQVIDRKPYEFAPGNMGRTVPAHEDIHNLGVRLVFDIDMVVRAVETFTRAAPYPQCPGGGQALQALRGVRIGAGWSRAIRERLSAPCSCTHLRELLIPMATAALQAMSVERQGAPDRLDATGRPVKIDSCYAYAAERQIVQQRWPEFAQAPAAGHGAAAEGGAT